jgi:flagellar hook-associated protein 1 FlgK
MSNMTIGLSGLIVAQRALDIVATNIANANTDGYHRQTPMISPVSLDSPTSPSIGGAEITEVRRAMDGLLESEILRNQPLQGQLTQELMTLQSIESSLGQLGSQGLTTALAQFFGDMRELAAQPQSSAQLQQTVWSAELLAEQFRNLGTFLMETADSLKTEAQDIVSQVNQLTGRIAELNTQILAGVSRGGSANLLADQRDQLVRELSEIIPIQTNGLAQTDSRNIMAWGVPLVIGAHATELTLGMNSAGKLGVSMKDSSLVETNISGGRLGALIGLRNNVITQLCDQLDTLANQVITSVNRLHVQGVGSSGAFEELTGGPVDSGVLSDSLPQVEAGSFWVRVTNTATGEVNRYKIDLDPAEDMLADVAARLDGVDHLSALAADSRLKIKADNGYTFDFCPGVEAQPTSTSLTGTAAPTISGNYSGSENTTYTFTIQGTGQVGITDGLALKVYSGGELVNTLSIGSGYAAGQRLAVADGVYVAMSLGTLTDGEQFTVEALAQSDSAGFLAAAGINTLFAGSSALTMNVNDEVLSDASRLAVSASPGGSDNLNALAMANLEDRKQAALGQLTPAEHLQLFISSIGQRVALAKSRQESSSQIIQQLENQRNGVSGVDINEEAAKLMMLERLFQACSKVINSQDQTIEYLMDMM